MNVPFVDLHAQYLGIKSEIDAAIAEVIARSTFIRGPYVERFEKAWAETLGVKHCVSCANGTDALYIAMRALGMKTGDEVFTTAYSWISTSETIPIYPEMEKGMIVFIVDQIGAFFAREKTGSGPTTQPLVQSVADNAGRFGRMVN